MSKPLHAIFCVLFMILAISVKSQNFGTRITGVRGIIKSVAEIKAAESISPVHSTTEENEEIESADRPQNPNAPRVSSYGVESLNQPSSVTGVNLSIHNNFLASDIAEGPGYRPPDCNGDISTVSQIMLAVNGRLKVYNVPSVIAAAATTVQTSSASALASPVLTLDMDVFFKNTPLGVSLVTDPHVRFDKGSGRWFIVAQDKSHSFQNYLTIAVSNSTTITAGSTFSIYYLQSSTGSSDAVNDWLDYPTFGVDKFALYIGANIFDKATHATNKGSSLYVINKASLLSGTLSATIWQYGIGSTRSGSVGGATMVGMLTPQAVHNDDVNATEGYFIATDWAQYSSMILKRVSNPGGTPTLSADMQLTVPATMGSIDQPALGSSQKISAFDDRLFAAMIMTNKITGIASLWTAQNIEVNTSGVGTAGGGRNGARWYELRNLSTTPTLYQSGTLYDASATARGFTFPSIAMNGQGHALLGSSTTAADRRVQVAIAGRYSSDAAGTLQPYDTVTQVTSGYNPAGSTVFRWGDYSQTVVDPSDNMTFWTFQQYTDNTNAWGLRAVQVMAPPPAQSVTVSGIPTHFCGLVVPVTLNGSATNNAGFFDPGTGYNRLAITCSGGIPVSNVAFVSATQVTCNINTAGIAAGTYTFTITNPDGQTVTATFTLAAPCSAAGVINYYNALNSDIKNVTNWWSNTDGATGSHPTDFITGNQVFNITHTGSTLGAALTLSGTGSKLILGDGSITNSFTIPSTFALNSNIDVANAATLNIANTTLPILGTLGATSTIAFTGIAAQPVPSATFGNLVVSTTGTGATATGNMTVNGNLTISAGSTFDMSSFLLSGSSLTASGTGTLKTQNTSAAPIPTGRTWTPNVLYNSGIAQTVVAGNYSNSDLTGGDRTLVNGGIISISGTYTPGTGTLTVTGNTVDFVGNNQIIPAALYNNLMLNNPGGTGTLSGDVSINGALNLVAGKIAIGGNSLTLGGTVSGMSASNCITGSAASNLSITGSGALGTLFFDQTIAGVTNALNNLSVNRTTSGSVILGNQLVLLNTYTPAAGVLTTGGFLVLRSNSIATARVAQGAAGGGYISGNVTVERFIPANANRSWRLLAIPTSTTNTINTAWQNGQVAGVSGPAGSGVFITSNNSDPSFDAQTSGNSMLTYNSVTNSYSGVLNTTSTINNPTSGYFLFTRGDRFSTPSNALITSTTLKTTGTLKQGTSSVITVPSGQYYLAGNPFPSEIDLTAVNRGNDIQDIYYVWDPKLLGSGGLGAFQTLTKNSGAGTYDVTPGAGSYGSQYKYIESGQAFFIHSTGSSTNTFSFPETAKSNGTSNILYTPTSLGEQFKINLYTAGAPNGLVDGNLVQYDNIYSDSVDAEDALKLSNFQANLALSRHGSLLAVERRPIIGINDTIFLNTSGLSQRQYQFEMITHNLDHPGLFGSLEDSYQPGLTIPINLNGTTTFTFQVTSDSASTSPGRFRVIFKPFSALPVTFTTVKAHFLNSDVIVDWTVENERNINEYEVERSQDGTSFTRLGTVSAHVALSRYTFTDHHPIEGVSFYRIRSIQFTGSAANSYVVKVISTSAKPSVSIYPDPVTSGKENLDLVNMPVGKYIARLINNIGQVVFSTQINHSEVNRTEIIDLGNLPKGIFHLEVLTSDNTRFTVKVTKY